MTASQRPLSTSRSRAAALRAAARSAVGIARWEALALLGCHLADDELALSDLLADVLELLLTLFLLTELLGSRHVNSSLEGPGERSRIFGCAAIGVAEKRAQSASFIVAVDLSAARQLA
jgi:hypothetical protein